MKTLFVETRPNGQLLIVRRFYGKHILLMICVSLGLMAMIFYVDPHNYGSPSSLQVLALAVFLLVFAFSRTNYLIQPRQCITIKLTIFGVPFSRSRIPAESLWKYEVVPEKNGNFTLRFLDASKQQALVIEGFSSERFADFAATSFRENDGLVQEKIDYFIKQAKRKVFRISPVISMLFVIVVFALGPVLLFGQIEKMNYFFYVPFGCLFTLGALVVTRPVEKITRTSSEDGTIEGWVEYGPFRVAEYHQLLGNEAKLTFTRVRFHRYVLLYPLLMGLQVWAIVCVAQYNTSCREKPKAVETNNDGMSYDAEQIQKGINRLSEMKKKRENAQEIESQSKVAP